MEQRVLILAPRGRDAQVVLQVLAGAALSDGCQIAASLDDILALLRQGAGAAIVTEEALAGGDVLPLFEWLGTQPSWSDFPFIVLVTKQGGRRTAEATARLLGMGNVVLLERPINAETLVSATNSALRARLRQYQSRDDRAAAEAELRRANEQLEQRILGRTAELRQANERLLREIAERERAEAALLQAQKMEAIGHLTGGIAHDFNNLLTAILGNLEMIGRRSTDERVVRMAGFAREAVARATKLTGQLLAFSRSQQLDLQSIDIDRMIEGMDDLMARSLGHTVEIRTRLASGGAAAMVDANQLELAVLNLAINARDAMPGGGRLTISTRVETAWGEDLKPGDYVVISVGDTGSGIPEAVLSKVFDPFFTTKSLGKGTGLGLSQVYGIARQCGGVARAANSREGGALIEVWLPVSSALAAGRPHAAEHASVPHGRGERILVVDDDPDVRRYIVTCLESLRYVVTEAPSGRAGLDRLNADKPDMLIVDFAMPGLNGAEVASLARQWCHDLPVILVTGYADARAVEQMGGSAEVLRKPFELAGLAESVRRSLEQCPAR